MSPVSKDFIRNVQGERTTAYRLNEFLEKEKAGLLNWTAVIDRW
jgi:hypothetical protein